MSYSKWRQEYWSKKVRFLRKNDVLFTALLLAVSKKIYIPDELDTAFKSHVKKLLVKYSEVYDQLIRQQLTTATIIETNGFNLLNSSFVKQAGIKQTVFNVDKFVSVVMQHELPSGKTLSRRVWDLRTYSKDINQIIRNGIKANLSPATISKQLDGFLLPGKHLTTLTPYGRTLGFDSMRLARTEVMNEFRRTDAEMMRRSPWVTGLRWELSSAHQGPCECDDLEGRIFTDADLVPISPHPQCMCALIPEVLTPAEWTDAMTAYETFGTDTLGIGEWLLAA